MKLRLGKAAAVVAAAGLLGGCGEGGTDAPAGVEVVQLGGPEAAFGVPFAVVSTVRELSGGRAVVADPLGQVVVSVDMDAGLADTIGGLGGGPAEYRQPDAVWPLPDGRTLLVDLGNGRLTVLGPELEFGETRRYAVVDPASGSMVRMHPQGVDGMGRIYFRGSAAFGEQSDSLMILRMDLETEQIDSVALFKTEGTTREESGDGNSQSVSITQIPLSPADAWGVAEDGRVVVVRALDYHVDWIGPDGVTSGPSVPYAPVRIGSAEKEEWRDRRAESGGGLSIEVGIVNGDVRVTAGRGGPGRDDDDLDGYPWPEAMPAFHNAPVPVDPLGRAWVRRHREAGAEPRYDLFDGEGRLAMSVEMPAGRRVVSFGDGTLYAVRMDEMGLQYLERYALP